MLRPRLHIRVLQSSELAFGSGGPPEVLGAPNREPDRVRERTRGVRSPPWKRDRERESFELEGNVFAGIVSVKLNTGNCSKKKN
jgi:hypothetical protein